MMEYIEKSIDIKSGKKILLGHLAAYGDCLYATAIARQIKQDYPGCHLTWAIGSLYASLLVNNPHVDEIWEVALNNPKDVAETWIQFEKQVKALQQQGVFDEIFLTQIYPNNFQNFDGTVRASIFRGYPKPITVPVSPVLYLTEEEVARVGAFAEKNRLQSYSQVILFEFASHSDQSFLDQEFAMVAAKKLVKKFSDICFVFSSHIAIDSDHPAIIDGSSLSFRENAELSKYCHLLVGCSSGITWLCTSEWAKRLPMIQLLKKQQSVFASVTHDFNHFNLDFDQIIEMTECTSDHLVDCISTFFNEGFKNAYRDYHEKIKLNFDFYFSAVNPMLQDRNQMKTGYFSIFNTFKRYESAFLFPCYLNFKKQYIYLEDNIHLLQAENNMLRQVCDERLQLIEKMDCEIQSYKKFFWFRVYIYTANLFKKIGNKFIKKLSSKVVNE